MQFKKSTMPLSLEDPIPLEPCDQYSIDELGRISPTYQTSWAKLLWKDAATFDEAINVAVFIEDAFPSKDESINSDEISILKTKRYLDIEEGFFLATGVNIGYSVFRFEWHEEVFFNIRPDYGFLLLSSDGNAPAINAAENRIYSALIEYHAETAALYRAIQMMELDPLCLYPIEWWQKFWAVRGITTLDQSQTDKPNNQPAEKPLKDTERNTLLTIIAALAKEADYDISKISKTGELIASLTQQMGAPVGATTIERHLKKIPEALKSRAK